MRKLLMILAICNLMVTQVKAGFEPEASLDESAGMYSVLDALTGAVDKVKDLLGIGKSAAKAAEALSASSADVISLAKTAGTSPAELMGAVQWVSAKSNMGLIEAFALIGDQIKTLASSGLSFFKLVGKKGVQYASNAAEAVRAGAIRALTGYERPPAGGYVREVFEMPDGKLGYVDFIDVLAD